MIDHSTNHGFNGYGRVQIFPTILCIQDGVHDMTEPGHAPEDCISNKNADTSGWRSWTSGPSHTNPHGQRAAQVTGALHDTVASGLFVQVLSTTSTGTNWVTLSVRDFLIWT